MGGKQKNPRSIDRNYPAERMSICTSQNSELLIFQRQVNSFLFSTALCPHIVQNSCARFAQKHTHRERGGLRHIVRWLPVTAAELISFYFYGKEGVSNLIIIRQCVQRSHSTSMKCPRKTRALLRDTGNITQQQKNDDYDTVFVADSSHRAENTLLEGTPPLKIKIISNGTNFQVAIKEW